MNEPSGLLIFSIMLGLIISILGLMAIASWLIQHATRDNLTALARRTWALLFPPPERAVRERPLRRRVPVRRTDGKLNGSVSVSETSPKSSEVVSIPVSPITVPKDDPETVAFRFLARLIHAGVLTETQALETACEVKAGSSKAYQEARARLKRALEAEQVEVA
jgi:hypothetical protein